MLSGVGAEKLTVKLVLVHIWGKSDRLDSVPELVTMEGMIILGGIAKP